MLRNFFIHSAARNPLARGDGMYVANNFAANYGYQNVQLNPCGSSGSTPDATTRMQFEWNLAVAGNNSAIGDEFMELADGSSLLT